MLNVSFTSFKLIVYWQVPLWITNSFEKHIFQPISNADELVHVYNTRIKAYDRLTLSVSISDWARSIVILDKWSFSTWHSYTRQLHVTLSSIGLIVQWKVGIMNMLWSFKLWTKWHFLSLIKTINIYIYINLFIIYVRHRFFHSARIEFISYVGVIFNVWYSIPATPHLRKDWIFHTHDERYFYYSALRKSLLVLNSW